MAADRAAVLPIPALIAAVVVCAALSLYSTALLDRDPGRERSVVEPAADDALDAATDSGVVDTSRLDESLETMPGGYEANVTVRAEGERWTAGPSPPAGAASSTGRAAASGGATADDDAAAASRVASVRVGPGQVRPGEFEVVVWS